jgi:hypothetical protein
MIKRKIHIQYKNRLFYTFLLFCDEFEVRIKDIERQDVTYLNYVYHPVYASFTTPELSVTAHSIFRFRFFFVRSQHKVTALFEMSVVKSQS